MKQLISALTAIGFAVVAVPAAAQQRCDSLAAARGLARPLTVARHEVLGPRDSSRMITRDAATRRVTKSGVMVTKSGVAVKKSKPVGCPVVAAAPVTTPAPVPVTSVGDVVPPAPVVAAGEVVPPFVPTVGSTLGFPLLGGLLLGGTAIAVGSHHPTAPVVATPIPVIPLDTTSTGGATGGGGTGGGTGGGGTGGGGTGGGGTGGGGTGGGDTGGGGTGGGGTGGGGTGGGGTGGGETGVGGTVVPEPATLLLTSGGLALLAGVARRRRWRVGSPA